MIDDKKTEQPEDTSSATTEEATLPGAGKDPAEVVDSPSRTPDDGAPQAQGTEDATPEGDAESSQEEPASEADTFPRSVVEKLRVESAGYRTRVRDLEQQLHRMQVEGTGALADASDLPFDPSHLESPEALQAAIDALIEAKPHLKARRFAPDAAAQGPKTPASAPVDLLGALRNAL